MLNFVSLYSILTNLGYSLTSHPHSRVHYFFDIKKKHPVGNVETNFFGRGLTQDFFSLVSLF